MFILWGSRTMRIKKYVDTYVRCEECGDFSQEFSIHQKYFHLFFIPLFPVGLKGIRCTCTKCGDRFNEEKKNYYLSRTKTPFYLYSGVILFVSLILFLIATNILTQKQKREYIRQPQKGDVYLVREDIERQSFYYFLKVNAMREDSVELIKNVIMYNGFVSSMQPDDYFIKESGFSVAIPALEKMVEDGRIISIERDYDGKSKFHREK